MSRISIALVALLFFAAAHDCRADPVERQHRPASELLSGQILLGQLLLPSGVGSRGVEIKVTVAEADRDDHTVWLLFAENGRFSHTFRGTLTSLQVTAGQGAKVHRIGVEKLALAAKDGRIDVGVIDLRDALKRHRIVIRAVDGTPPGVVRAAMWFGPPPTGPSGEPVALGSRQFPPITLGEEKEWLVSHAAEDMYILVERPADAGRGRKWRSGRQRLFGPYTAGQLPVELLMD